jgi:hypothetical protein
LSVVVALFALLAPANRVVLAQNPRSRPAVIYGASNAKVAGIIAGIAGAGIALGVGVTMAVKHENHSVAGCAHSGPDGVELTSDSDKQTYTLIGDVAGVKSGDRVRVSGKKSKDKAAGTRQFLVEKVSKDLGPCEADFQVR